MADINEKLLNGAGLAELWLLVKAADNAVLDHVDKTFSKIQTGTYVGTGSNKEAGANSITFDFVPKIIFFHTFGKSNYHSPFAFLSVGDLTSEYKAHAFTTYDGNETENANYAKIVGTTVSWYTTTSASGFVGNAQMNTSGATYYWIAIG
jgi:hypothetical protein